jgi:hypothetical protein
VIRGVQKLRRDLEERIADIFFRDRLGSWNLVTKRLDFAVEIGERDRAGFPIARPERDALAKDVDRQNFLFATRSDDDLAFLGKTLSRLHVEVVLVAQTAHQPPARAGDLRRIQRQALILRDTQIHGSKLGQPR